MPDRSPDPRDVRVREALALRRWALPALCGASDGPPPAVSRGGWSTFLRAERCALPLLALGDGALGEGAPHVRRRAAMETQRVLSAGAQIHLLGKVARRDGARFVVLKGGVPLAEGRPGVDVVDVDVLAAPAQAQALGATLDASGYTARGRASSHRLAERVTEDGVQVEIHTGVPGIGAADAFLARAVPSRVAGVLAPHPADQLWHLLIHSVAQHAGRRGSLRELVLLADALGRCGPEDLPAVEARMDGRPDGPALRAQLALAQSLRARRPPAADPFAGVAAAAYSMTERLAPLRLPVPLKAALAESVFMAVARRAGTGPALADAAQGPARGGPLRWLARRVPRWVLAPPALLLARQARRAAGEGEADGGDDGGGRDPAGRDS